MGSRIFETSFFRIRESEERPVERGYQVRLDGRVVHPVLDFDDRAVEDVEELVVAHAGVLRHLLPEREVLGAGDVAEEVALSLRPGEKELRSFLFQQGKQYFEGAGNAFRRIPEFRRPDVSLANPFQVDELLEILLEAEVALELAEEGFQAVVKDSSL